MRTSCVMAETSGRKASAVGKPPPAGFLAAASRIGVDPDNDVLAAQVARNCGQIAKWPPMMICPQAR
jgi:hypothetical protein